MSIKLFNLAVKIFVFGSMLFFKPGMLAYKPQEMFIQYGVFLLFALSYCVPPKREISNVWIGVLFVYLLAQTILGNFVPFSRLALMNFFLGVVAIKVIAERIDLDLASWGKWFVWICLINSGWLILQHYNIDPLFSSAQQQNMPEVDMVGFLGAKFALGCVGAIALPFIYAYRKWLVIVTLPLLYCSKSSTVLGIASVAFAFLIITDVLKDGNRKKLFFISLFGVVTVLLACLYIFQVDLPTGQFHKRLLIWGAGINIWSQDPIFGHGLGMWTQLGVTTMQENGMPEVWTWAHNEFIQFLVETGIVGLILLGMYMKNTFEKIKNPVLISLTLILVVIAFFHFPFHIGRLSGIGIAILSLIEAFKRSEDEKDIISNHYIT